MDYFISIDCYAIPELNYAILLNSFYIHARLVSFSQI